MTWIRRCLPALLLGGTLLLVSSCSKDHPTSPLTRGTCTCTPSQLDFGTVRVGQSAARSFTISCTGSAGVSGSVSVSAVTPFSLVGDTAYALQPGESRSFTVRFIPQTPGPANATIVSGCGSVACSGSGVAPAACRVRPARLDFGNVPVGARATLGLTIANVGGDTLSGVLQVSAPNFGIAGNSGYRLAGGDSATFTVWYLPARAGADSCELRTDCLDIPCRGSGYLPPACQISPTSLDFGAVAIGTSADRALTVSNVGGSTLMGAVAAGCGAFKVLSPDSSLTYALGAGQSKTFTVRFTPTAAGKPTLPNLQRGFWGTARTLAKAGVTQACAISTGSGGCAAVSCTGLGVPPSVNCSLTPKSLNFGNLTVGFRDTLTLTLANVGDSRLSGVLRPSCPEYQVVRDSTYDLAPSQFATFKICFAPSLKGIRNCALDLGNQACSSVQLLGTGVPGPDCRLDTGDYSTDLNLDTTAVGGHRDATLRLTNSGLGLFDANFVADEPSFSVLNSPIRIQPGTSVNLTLRFAPTVAGRHIGHIWAPGLGCDSVTVFGTAYIPPLAPGPGHLVWGSAGSGPGQFNGIAGLAVDSSGYVYVADSGNDRIQKFTADGSFVKAWGEYGAYPGQFDRPTGVAVDRAGYVFVTDLGSGRVQKFASDGTFVTQWQVYYFDGHPSGSLYGIAISADGSVFVSDPTHETIVRLSSAGQYVTNFGGIGIDKGHFEELRGVAVDGLGDVLAADGNYCYYDRIGFHEAGNRIQRFTPMGTFLGAWDSLGTAPGAFADPSWVAADAAGFLYVSDGEASCSGPYAQSFRVQKLNANGTYVQSWGAFVGVYANFHPSGVAVSRDGYLYVGDNLNNQIQRFGTAGAPRRLARTVAKKAGR